MSIRSRFRLLLTVFGVFVVGNVLVSVWCIHTYVAGATDHYRLLTDNLRQTDQTLRLVDELVHELRQRADRVRRGDLARDQRYRALHRRIAAQVATLPADRRESNEREALMRLGGQLSQRSEQFVEALDSGRRGDAEQLLAGAIVRDCAEPMKGHLERMARDTDQAVQATAADVYQKERSVTVVLAINAVAAFLLTAIGVHLTRNWVLKPIASLKRAAEQYAAGELSFRIPQISNDEFGALSQQVNRMADSLAKIQARLVEQERLAAVGEVTSTVAHNVRNPLASIRAAAQSCAADMPERSEFHAACMSIIEMVDSMNRWFRELLHVSQPIELACRDVCLAELAERVMSVLQPDARKRDLQLRMNSSPPGLVARVDGPRIEQALLSVVTNALEASPPQSTVDISIRPHDGNGWIDVNVTDRGPGIPGDVMRRIASANFTTKSGGRGIGLYLARRTVRAHGGDLEFVNNETGGTMVTLRLPAMIPTRGDRNGGVHPTG